MKRCSNLRRLSNVTLILSLAITLLLLSGLTLDAQEIVDPRSGQLLLSVTDLTVQAGPVTLEVRRSLESGQRQPGLLGSRWRLNWESRAVSTPTGVVIDEVPYAVAFTRADGAPEYQSVTGERLVLQGDGRFVRTMLSGRTETFDQQGRLIERDYRNGNKAIVRYGADGRIARIDGPRGSVIQFSADNQGRVTRIETSTGASVRYAYAGDNLTEVQVNGGPVMRYAYDTRGALTRIDHPRSGAVELAYDARQRVVSRRWADGAKERFEYDDAAREQRRIDPTGAVTVTRFDQDGRRAEVIEPRGGKIAIGFDANGRPESVTGPTGETAKIVYDALGRAAAFHDLYRQVTHYEYLGATGRVKAIARPDAPRESFAYDAQQNLTEIKLGSQTLATLAYNLDGTLGVAKALGLAEHRLTYDGQARLQTLTNPLGERLQLSYDARGNPLRAVNPLGGVTAWQWNAQDQLVSETDPLGATTRYEYDSSGRLTRAIDPLGRAIRFEYDVRGRLVAEADPSGQQTRYQYDRAGRLVKLSSGAASESFRYDPAGNLIEWVDRLGRTVQMDYDALGRVTQKRWSTGLQVHYRYDARGQLTVIADSAGRKLEWQHDARGRIIAQRDALGATTQFQYDALGNVTTRRDPRGHVKQFAYTADGSLARVQEPSGDAAEYRYDAAHRLVEMVRPSGGRSRFTYNGLGHLTQEVDPLGHERRYQYDVAGRLVASTDAMRRTTRYAYDAAGRLTEKRFADGKHVAFKYDSVGNLLEADDGAFPVRYQYDREGRRVKVEYPAIKKTIAYEYDAAGLRTKLIGPDRRVTRYEYDGHKQLSAIVPSEGKRIGLSYDAQQRLQSIAYPNGLTGRWQYDTAGRVTKLAYAHGSGKPISAWTYHYDPDGNLVRQKDTEGRDTTYSYDAAGQLTETAGSAGVVRYRYGRGGSRVAMEAGAGVTSYRHDSADRLIEAGPETLTYDLNGNLLRRQGPGGSTSYEYDPEDRLVKVQASDGKTTTFGYAPTGERVWKRDAGGLTYYLYDGLDLIQELDEKGNVRAAYVHGPGIDQPLAMLREEKSFYYHADRLGSVRALTDDRGSVAATYDYDVFGKLESRHDAASNPFTFTGREWDDGTGLYYYRARSYDPALGRFLSPDRHPAPLDEPRDHDPYLYVRNQPLRFVDASGLAPSKPSQEMSLDELRALKGHLTDLSFRNIRASLGIIENAQVYEGRRLTPDELRRLDRLDASYQGVNASGKEVQAELNRRGYVPAPPKPAELTPAENEWVNNWVRNVHDPAAAVDAEAAAAAQAQAATRGELTASGRGRNPTLTNVPVARGTERAGTLQVPRSPVEAGGAALAEAEAGAALAAAEEGAALARLKGVLPTKSAVKGTVALIALPAAADAINEFLWAEPGKRLEAAGDSLGKHGRGVLESGKKIGGCAAIGAIIGGCIGNVPGAIVGAKIGAAVPVVIDTVKTLVQIPQDIRDLQEIAKRRADAEQQALLPDDLWGGPSGEEPTPSTDRPVGSLAGPVTEGLPGAPPVEATTENLPGAPPVWTPGGDLNVSQGGAGPTPAQIAEAGRQGFEGVPRTSDPAGGKSGGEKTGFGGSDPRTQVTTPEKPSGAEKPSGPGLPQTSDTVTGKLCWNDSTRRWERCPEAGKGFDPVTTGMCYNAQTRRYERCPEKPRASPGSTAKALPGPQPSGPAPGAKDVDLSGTWYATYRGPVGENRFTMTLSRVKAKAGMWEGPLDYVTVGRPDLTFKTTATLQATGVGQVHLTYMSPGKLGKLDQTQQADGTYTSSQITFGNSPNTVTYTRKK